MMRSQFLRAAARSSGFARAKASACRRFSTTTPRPAEVELTIGLFLPNWFGCIEMCFANWLGLDGKKVSIEGIWMATVSSSWLYGSGLLIRSLKLDRLLYRRVRRRELQFLGKSGGKIPFMRSDRY